MVYRVDVKHVTNFLHEVDIFRGLAERQLDRIAGLCEEWSFRTGDYLGVQNEQGSRLYVIRYGEITVTTTTDEMDVVVRTVRERETLPVAVLFEPPLLVTTARAATDGEALVIPRVRLLELCELDPKIGMHVYKSVCGILMNRYRYTLHRLSGMADLTISINSLADGAEV